MRVTIVLLALAMILPSAAIAQQEVRKAEDWQKMYQDASAQLRAAQNRKAALANDNAKLNSQVLDMSRRLALAESELDMFRRQADSYAEQTFFLNEFHTNVFSFMQRNEVILERWKAFTEQNLPGLPDDQRLLCDPAWPFYRE